MSEFQEKIAIAQATATETHETPWIETSPEIIKALRPRGLGIHNGQPIKHFCYHGVIVCEFGKTEEIQEEMNQSLNEKMHGKHEAKVISGG